MQLMWENSPVGESKSNGFIERTNQTIEAQIRTMINALEARIGCSLSPDTCVRLWLVIHAGALRSLYETGKDGRVPFQRLRGRKLKMDALEFGESIHYLPLDRKEIGKLESK